MVYAGSGVVVLHPCHLVEVVRYHLCTLGHPGAVSLRRGVSKPHLVSVVRYHLCTLGDRGGSVAAMDTCDRKDDAVGVTQRVYDAICTAGTWLCC